MTYSALNARAHRPAPGWVRSSVSRDPFASAHPRCTPARGRRHRGVRRRHRRRGRTAAKSKTPCWKTLINDWYDGRIDGDLPDPLLPGRAASTSRRTSTRTRAPGTTSGRRSEADHPEPQRRQRRRRQGDGGGPGGGGTSGGGSAGGGTSGGGTRAAARQAATARSATSRRRRIRPKADSLPVPLLVLGGVAILLMAAGAAGSWPAGRARGKPSSLPPPRPARPRPEPTEQS